MEKVTVAALFAIAVCFCFIGANELLPSGWTEVVEGQGLYVRFVDDFPNLTACTADIPGLGDNASTTVDWNIEHLRGKCGVMVLSLKQNNSGPWILRATYLFNNSLKNEEQYLNVSVVEPPAEPVPLMTQVGEGEQQVIAVGDEQSAYCILEDPEGQVAQVTRGKCQLTVSSRDEGVWKAVYAVFGSLKEISVNYSVEAQPMEMLTSVQASSSVDGAIDLLCRLPAIFISEPFFCRMVHPNGTGLHVQDGLSDGRYGYYGSGLRSEGAHDCGITIYRPTDEDYGVWKCIFAFENSLKGSYLYVNRFQWPSTLKMRAEATRDKVVALSGSNVTLLCRTQASLAACWFRHPDGSVVTTSKYWGRYTYYGEGLTLGDCGIHFVAQPADSGQWTCYLGIPDNLDGDLATTIQLDVITEPLVTLNDVITATVDDSVTLGCKTAIKGGIGHCRFVHPTGWGMTFSGQKDASAIRDRYRYEGNGLSQGECFLQILSVKEEDYGTWICAASLMDGTVTEVMTRVSLQEQGGISVGVITGIVVVCLLTVGFAGAIIAGYIKRTKKAAESTA